MIERILIEGILKLRIAHGKANALDVELLDALIGELEGAKNEARALILTGTGSIFSAGVDLLRLIEGGADYVRRFLPLLSRFVRELLGFPKPVVAAVNGHAIAGGCIIVLASDIRLMAEGDGKIGLPELLVGVPFPIAPMEVMKLVVPRDKLQALMYTGRTLGHQDAIAAGLIDEMVPSDQLQARAFEVARQLAAIPPEPFRLTKLGYRAEALARIESASEKDEQATLDAWSATETQSFIREYVKRTLRK